MYYFKSYINSECDIGYYLENRLCKLDIRVLLKKCYTYNYK